MVITGQLHTVPQIEQNTPQQPFRLPRFVPLELRQRAGALGTAYRGATVLALPKLAPWGVCRDGFAQSGHIAIVPLLRNRPVWMIRDRVHETAQSLLETSIEVVDPDPCKRRTNEVAVRDVFPDHGRGSCHQAGVVFRIRLLGLPEMGDVRLIPDFPMAHTVLEMPGQMLRKPQTIPQGSR